MRRVSPTEAHALMRDEGYAYLDVRSVPEFDAGHPEGAFNVPWLEAGATGMSANPHFVVEVAAAWSANSKIVIGCKAGTRSEQAAQALAAAGFSDIVIQRAGMDGIADPFGRIRDRGWRGEGLPVAHEALPGRSHSELRARAQISNG